MFATAPSDYTGDSIDGNGMTILPGLIDAHTHIACLRRYDNAQLRNPMKFFTSTCFSTQRYLDYGFTTIRDCGVPLRVNIAVRDAVDAGLFTGPRIIACGLILSPTETPEDDFLTGIYENVDGTNSARRAVRRELAEGAEFIKVMASGSGLQKSGIPEQPIITEPELSVMVEAAAMKGSYVAAHAHGDGAIRLCVETGVRTIEHASYISDETLSELLKRDSCWIIPTVSAMYQNPETTSEEYMYLVKKLDDMLKKSSVCLKKAYEAGARLGFGTDSCPGMDQYEQGMEFRMRHELCGMSNIDILLQATKYNAQALGIDGETGQIIAGLSADLILVDGHPDEDISMMYKKPVGVFTRGKKVK